MSAWKTTTKTFDYSERRRAVYFAWKNICTISICPKYCCFYSVKLIPTEKKFNSIFVEHFSHIFQTDAPPGPRDFIRYEYFSLRNYLTRTRTSDNILFVEREIVGKFNVFRIRKRARKIDSKKKSRLNTHVTLRAA